MDENKKENTLLKELARPFNELFETEKKQQSKPQMTCYTQVAFPASRAEHATCCVLIAYCGGSTELWILFHIFGFISNT